MHNSIDVTRAPLYRGMKFEATTISHNDIPALRLVFVDRDPLVDMSASMRVFKIVGQDLTRITAGERRCFVVSSVKVSDKLTQDGRVYVYIYLTLDRGDSLVREYSLRPSSAKDKLCGTVRCTSGTIEIWHDDEVPIRGTEVRFRTDELVYVYQEWEGYHGESGYIRYREPKPQIYTVEHYMKKLLKTTPKVVRAAGGIARFINDIPPHPER